MRSARLFGAVILLGVVPSARAQTAEDRAAVEKFITGYLDAVARNDLKVVMGCWASDTPKSQLEEIQQGFQRYSSIGFRNLRVSDWTWKPTVSLRLRADVEWQLKAPAFSWRGSADRIIGLKKEQDVWRLTSEVETVDVVAKVLFMMDSSKQRTEFLTDDDYLRAAGLLDRLIGNALSECFAGREATGDKWLSLAEEIAGLLDDPKSQGQLWLGKGQIQSVKGSFAGAERCIARSIDSFNKAKDSDGEFAARDALYSFFVRLRQADNANL